MQAGSRFQRFTRRYEVKEETTRTRIFGLVSTLALGLGLIVVMACAIGLLLPKGPALSLATGPEAGVINVTTTKDEYDIIANDFCSLREAVQAINDGADFGGCSNPGGTANTVQLQAHTYPLKIPNDGNPPWNDSGSLAPIVNMIIRGVGPGQTVIDGTALLADVVIYVQGCAVALEELTVQGGVGGGVEFYDIPASPPSPPCALTHVIVEDVLRGAGVSFRSENVAGSSSARLEVTDTIIRNNQWVGGRGAGLSAMSGGQVILDRVTIHDNVAQLGGGIFFDGAYTGRTFLQMTNVTIYSNTVTDDGGGLFLSQAITTANRATNVTIARNQAGDEGGNVVLSNSAFRVRNVILAGGMAKGSANNCAGMILTSLDFNLDTDNTCGLTEAHDIHPPNAGLAPALADNGGDTPTLALLPSSPALDHGIHVDAPPIDQRGVPRPQGPAYDIGAFEAQPKLKPLKIVDDDTPTSAQTVTFTVVISNAGVGSAASGLISDTIPEGLHYVDGSAALEPPTAGMIGAPPSLAYSLTITGRRKVTLTFAVTVDPETTDGTTITNTAAISSAEVIKPRLATETLTILAPALSVSKAASDDTPAPGGTLTYTIVVANSGSTAATGAVISDTIPAGIHYVAGSAVLEPPSAGVTGTPPALVTGLTISPGDSVTLTFAVTVSTDLTGGTVITNTAAVTGTEVSVPQTGEAVVTVEMSWIYLPVVMRTYP
jgi:uncharacterized repeat protein (TIGR01451 family)/CSLREA domain-containing protein